MEAIAAQLVAARVDDVLLVAQTNAGLPQLVGDHFEYDVPPQVLAAHALAPARPRNRPDRRVLRLEP